MPTSAGAPKGRGRRAGVARWTGAAGIAAAVVFTIGWFVAGLLEPGYDWVRQDVSDLTAATAENPWVFRAAETLAAALLLVFALGLYGAVGDRWSGRVGAALLALFAAVSVAVGAYLHLDCSLADPACRSAEHTTRHELHEALSGVSFLALLSLFSRSRAASIATSPGDRSAGRHSSRVPRRWRSSFSTWCCEGAGRRDRPAPRDNDELRLDRRYGLSTGLATSRGGVPRAPST